MSQITPDFIKQCLTTQTDYKNSKIIKTSVQNNEQQNFQIICKTISDILNNRNTSPMQKLLALRLSKELIDVFNIQFVDNFEIHTLKSLKQYAEFNWQTDDPNRGASLFGENIEKETRQIGVSLVRMALDCVQAWARFFPTDKFGSRREFFNLYHSLKQKGVNFPSWAYYKEDFVKQNEHGDFIKQFDLLNSDFLPQNQANPNVLQQSQQIKIEKNTQLEKHQQKPDNPLPQTYQTPMGNPTPGNTANQVVQQASLIEKKCQQLPDKIGNVCAVNLNYKNQLFDEFLNEAAALHSEIDNIVNDLIELEEEDIAAQLLIEMENMEKIQKDIQELNQQPQQYPQFKRLYLKNKKDIALEEELERKRQQEEKRKFEEQERKRLEEEEQERKRKQEEQDKKRKLEEQERKRLEEEEQERKRQQEKLQKEKFEKEQKLEIERQLKLQKQEEERRIYQQKIDQQQKEDELKKLQQLEKEKKELENQKKEEQRRLDEQSKQDELRRQEELRKQDELRRQEEQKRQDDQRKQEELRRQEEQRKQEELRRQEEQRIQEEQRRQEELRRLEEQRRQDEFRLQQEQKKQQFENLQYLENQNKQEEQQQQSQIQINQDQKIVQQLIGNQQEQFPNQVMNQQSIIQSKVQPSIMYVTNKPVSKSKQQRQQYQVSSIKGDIVAPEIQIQDNTQQNQLAQQQQDIINQQIQQLINEKNQYLKKLQDEENTTKKLREDLDAALSKKDFSYEVKEQQFQIKQYQTEIIQYQKEKQELQRQIDVFAGQKNNFEFQKQQLIQQHAIEIKSYKAENQQLYQEKKSLLDQLDDVNKQNQKNGDFQNQLFRLEQQIIQLKRDNEILKNEKNQLQLENQKDVDQLKYQINEKQNFIDTLNNQINIYKTSLEKSQKDYAIQQEKQRELNEQNTQQIFEVRKELLQKQSQITQLQLQNSDQAEEIKQLQLKIQAIISEKNQIQKNLDLTQSQLSQLLQKNIDNRSSTLLQQKLKQTLDELDKVRDDNKKNIQEREEFYQNRIYQLTEDNQKLQKDIRTLQDDAMKQALEAKKPQSISIHQRQSKPKSVQACDQSDSDVNQFISKEIKINEISNQQLLPQLKKQSILSQDFIQQPCPLNNFKNFQLNRKFNKEKRIIKQTNNQVDCLDLIFPYSTPEDYYRSKQEKQRKGRTIRSNFVFNDIIHFTDENQSLFKQRCLGSPGVLYEEYGLQFGLMYRTQTNQNKQNYHTFGLYITNQTQTEISLGLQFLSVERFSQFWSSPIPFVKNLEADQTEFLEIIVLQNKTFLQLLEVQVKLSDIHPYQIYIPIHICQLIQFQEFRTNDFKLKWKSCVQNQMKSEILNLNRLVFRDYQLFLQQFSKFKVLNQHKKNDYEMGIDEIKLGAIGNLNDINFYIKFEILPDDRICIFLTYEQKYHSKKNELEQILQGYAFIFENGKF